MNILISVDDNYIEQALVMLSSLFRNTQGSIRIFCLDVRLSDRGRSRLGAQVKKAGQSITFIKTDMERFADAPKRIHLSIETYSRVVAAELLTEVERVIWLDADLIVNGDLRELWETDMGNASIAGVADPGEIRWDFFHKYRLGLARDAVYINGGVLVMDLSKIRKKYSFEDILSLIKEKGETLRYQDQDIINILFAEEIKQLPRKWNVTPMYYSLRDFRQYELKPHNAVPSAQIIHYFGKMKPWLRGYGHKYLQTYWDVCKRTDCWELRRNVRRNMCLYPLLKLRQGYYSWRYEDERKLRSYWAKHRGRYRESLNNKGYKTVAIYGAGFWGGLVYEELVSAAINVKYVADSHPEGKNWTIPIRQPSVLADKGIDLVIVAIRNRGRQVMQNIGQYVNAPYIMIEDFVYGRSVI